MVEDGLGEKVMKEFVSQKSKYSFPHLMDDDK